MASKFTSASTYFEELAKSSDFLNFLLNNISTAVLILNQDLELQAFNDPLKTIFSGKKDEHLLYVRCGEALGCAYQVEEQTLCGESSHCKSCRLRIDSIEAYASKEPIFKKRLIRDFYKLDGTKEIRQLIYSIKPVYFDNYYYLLVLIDDATHFLNKQDEMRKNSNFMYLD